MAEPVRHRRTKGAATDTFSLQQPRHTSTLPIVLKKSGTEGPSAIFESEGPVQHRFIAIARAITNHSFVRSSASDFFNTIGRVEVWRGCCRLNVSVAAPFVRRCLTGSAMAPSPHLAHRTGHADLPHPALGQDLTPSPTTRRAQADLGVRARSARRGARVDRSRLCVA